MKNLFLIGMAAASMMLASCSSDENVEMANNKNAIEFKTFVNNSTRTTNDATADNLMKFKIWGRFESKDGTKKGAPFVARDMTKQVAYGLMALRWFIGRRIINIVSRLLLRTMLIRLQLQQSTVSGAHLPLTIKKVKQTLFMQQTILACIMVAHVLLL